MSDWDEFDDAKSKAQRQHRTEQEHESRRVQRLSERWELELKLIQAISRKLGAVELMQRFLDEVIKANNPDTSLNVIVSTTPKPNFRYIEKYTSPCLDVRLELGTWQTGGANDWGTVENYSSAIYISIYTTFVYVGGYHARGARGTGWSDGFTISPETESIPLTKFKKVALVALQHYYPGIYGDHPPPSNSPSPENWLTRVFKWLISP